MAVSVLHCLLCVCSETHICKMSQKCAGPHIENCAFHFGRITKLEKAEKSNGIVKLARRGDLDEDSLFRMLKIRVKLQVLYQEPEQDEAISLCQKKTQQETEYMGILSRFREYVNTG